MVDFDNIDSIKNSGFLGFKKVKELFLNDSSIPEKMGVYMILYIGQQPPEFLKVGTGGHFKGKNPNVPIAVLDENWVENTCVIYIGKAGGVDSRATLRSRLRQYFRFGSGENVGHYGGRLIWQLKNSRDLIVCWKPLQKENPRSAEYELITQFVLEYKKRPFANLTG